MSQHIFRFLTYFQVFGKTIGNNEKFTVLSTQVGDLGLKVILDEIFGTGFIISGKMFPEQKKK